MNAYDMAKQYYPILWDEKRLKMLLEAGLITVREYEEIIGK